MRTLNEITSACRRGEPVTEEELRYAVCAYDVMVAQFEIENHAVLLEKYFVAAEMDVKEYVGPNNDPNDPEVQKWHRAFAKVNPT